MIVDPISPAYWDEAAYEKEARRIFEICEGCRLCSTICPSFVTLFDITDAVEGDMSRLQHRDWLPVVDQCYQCKLCYVRCPYTPPHDWQVDFPRWVYRARAIETRRNGRAPFRERFLSDIDRSGAISSTFAPLVNFVNGFKPARIILEKVLGIHRNKSLPRFYRETFSRWWSRRRDGDRSLSGAAPAEPAPGAPALREAEAQGTGETAPGIGPTPRKAALFYTCQVNYNEPGVGRACVEVLERSNIPVTCPEQECCGAPFLDDGDLEAARRKMRSNLASLKRAVAEGYDIVVPSPTCSLTLKQEYPRVLGPEAEPVAARTYDICEYLMLLHGEGVLNTDFQSSPGRVVYHLPCHLKAQNIGYKSRDLLQLIPGAEVEISDRCSGHDGSWAMKTEYFEISLKTGRRLFSDVTDAQPATVASDCRLAGLQITQGTGRPTKHPVELLRDAYLPARS